MLLMLTGNDFTVFFFSLFKWIHIFKFPGLKFLIPIDIDSISIDIRHINKFLLDSLFLRMLEVLRPKFLRTAAL